MAKGGKKKSKKKSRPKKKTKAAKPAKKIKKPKVKAKKPPKKVKKAKPKIKKKIIKKIKHKKAAKKPGLPKHEPFVPPRKVAIPPSLLELQRQLAKEKVIAAKAAPKKPLVPVLKPLAVPPAPPKKLLPVQIRPLQPRPEAPKEIEKQPPKEAPRTTMEEPPPRPSFAVPPLPRELKLAFNKSAGLVLPPPPRMVPGPLIPDLDLLPEWEDRERLRRIMEEDGLSFSAPLQGSPEFTEAVNLVSKKKAVDSPVLVCAKNRAGKVIGAVEAYRIPNGSMVLLFITRVSISGYDKLGNLHLLLYAGILTHAKPTHVMFSMARPPSADAELAARLIFLGRTFGMAAIPAGHRWLFFLRRIGKEYDMASTGEELAKIVSAARPFLPDGALDSAIEELRKKDIAALIPLPTSPDRREHLHEFKDAVIALGIPADALASVIEHLRKRYVLDRADMAPAFL